jgi:hypothetical protein
VIRSYSATESPNIVANSGAAPIAFVNCAIDCQSYHGSAIRSSGGVGFTACSMRMYASHRGDAMVGTGGAAFEGCTVWAGGDDLPGIRYDTVVARDTAFTLHNWTQAGQGAWQGGDLDLERCTVLHELTGNGIDLTGTFRMRDCVIGPPVNGQTKIWAARIEADNCRVVGGNTWASYMRFSTGWVRNCTITGFYTSFRPSIELLTSDATISNTVVRGSPGSGPVITVPVGASGLVNHCCVRGWDPALGGVGNFDLDPLLDSAGRLMAGSPCIDAGSNALAGGAAYDIDGRCRVVDGDGNGVATVDIGASEYTTCAIDCDCETAGSRLTVSDLMCFMARFGSGDPWANCDGSTVAPALNVLDFNCYLNRFVAGCP